MLNKVILIGRIATTPQIITLESGTKIGNFSLAHNRSYKDRDGNWKEEAHFFDVKVFNGLNEKLQKLQKGDLILVEGRLSQERWTTQDGKIASRVRIIAKRIQLIKRKQTETSQGIQTSEENPELLKQIEEIEKELGLTNENIENENTQNFNNKTDNDDDLEIIL